MRFLITGGAGFIGSHLAESLLAAGETVDVIDDLSTGSIANIEHLKGAARFRYVIGSVDDRPVLAELVDRADVVVHLAAAVGVRLIVERPVHTIYTNVHGTEQVLEAAAKKCKRVIIASTSEVYGKSSEIPFSENGDMILGSSTKARWGYACSKALDEFLAMAYWREHRLPITIVRLFNTVGPRQTGRYGMVLPTFVSQALSRQPITVFGDGSQSRCFTHVSDVVTAITTLSREPKAIGEIFNIGSDEETTIGALARLVRDVSGSDSPIVQVPYDEAYTEGFEDMPRRVPDLEKIRALIGYQPRLGLREIVASVIDSVLLSVEESVSSETVHPPRAPVAALP
jgi:UDP-glucose 4-epimerase